MNEFKPLGDLIAVGYDTPQSLKQTQAGSRASFTLLSDMDLKVTRLYNMQLREGWPMYGMGDIPEMGYVVVGPDGNIRAQRVDLYFGDNANDILTLLKKSQ